MTSENKEKQLSTLWQSIFDEDEFVTKLFFEKVYDICQNPFIEESGEILSSAFLIPCEISEYKGFYVYCAFTHNEYRGKGLMAKVLKSADEILQKMSSDFLLLVPAEKSLFDFYGKFGYVPFGYSLQADIPKAYTEITAKYSELRNFDGTEEKFPDCVTDFWADSVKHYGGKIIETDGNICLLGEKMLDSKKGIKINNTAMIKTDITELREKSCYIGITLE